MKEINPVVCLLGAALLLLLSPARTLFAANLDPVHKKEQIERELKYLRLDRNAALTKELEELNGSWADYLHPFETPERRGQLERQIRTEIPQKIAALESELAELVRHATVHRITTQGLSETDLSSVQGSSAYFFHNDRVYLFDGDAAFEAWFSENHIPPSERVDYYASKDPTLRRCLANPGVFPDNFISVQYKSQGKYPNIWGTYAKSPVQYSLRKTSEGRIHIIMKLYLKYSGPEEERGETLGQMKDVFSCVEDVYARSGLQLNLFYNDGSSYGVTPLESDHIITLENGEVIRGYYELWAMKKVGDHGVKLTPAKLCTQTTHEISHLLGLDDLYPDPAYPTRPVGPPDAINYCTYSSTPLVYKIYPEDMKIIVSPLCGSAF